MARRSWIVAVLFLLAGAGTARAGAAEGKLVAETGRNVGTVRATQVPEGLRVSVTAQGLPPGLHGMHLHEVGVCVPPFTSAGGHFNPTGKKHGARNPEGRHLGDLPNVTVAPDGTLRADVLAEGVVLEGGGSGLLDADGAALVLHADLDDEVTDPSGNAGRRIACAPLRKVE